VTASALLTDDQTVVRAGFRTLLGLTDDLLLVGEAADGQQAVDHAGALRPDVVLMSRPPEGPPSRVGAGVADRLLLGRGLRPAG
jgi:DNA-binding NarL/FixJ family response regulator